jgi:hypothetical protein
LKNILVDLGFGQIPGPTAVAKFSSSLFGGGGVTTYKGEKIDYREYLYSGTM